MWAGNECGGRGVCVYPFFHFFVSSCCDGAREWSSDELGSESEEFFVSVFVDVRDDLSLCVSWICFSGVHNCAGDSDFADCFKFVGVADDVSDLGVVSAKDGCEVEWCT